MTSENENNNLTLGWNDHAEHLQISFASLLTRKEFVDVTLIADGHSFDAHRLVLSALSPYLRQVFAQMPINQPAIVFMKDVAKETMVQLMTFIYTGEVNIPPQSLTEFIKTAEGLKIKGLAGDPVREQPNQQTPIDNDRKEVQFQSSQINRSRVENLSGIQLIDTPTTSHQQVKTEPDDEQLSDATEVSNAYGIDNDLIDSIDHDENGGNQTANSESNSPNTKRAKQNEELPEEDFNVVANVQKSEKGVENLFYGGEKFFSNQFSSQVTKQRWYCVKRYSTIRCGAIIDTLKTTNGTFMMKVIADEHSHMRNE